MRCLALAQCAQDSGGQAIIAMAGKANGVEVRLVSEGFDIERISPVPGSDEDAHETVSLARQLAAEWVVLDGYHFSGQYQRLIKEAGFLLLVIDDGGHAEHYWADAVLNQNPYAAESLYPSREPSTQLLLGTRYILLRREFMKWRGWQRSIPQYARKVLVTLGGSDPDNVTQKVIHALRYFKPDELEAVILLGPGNPHLSILEAATGRCPIPIRIRVNEKNIPELLSWADVAVAAGGTSSWERALLGLPSLVIVLAENQKEVAEALAKVGIAWNMGCHQSLLPHTIAATLRQLLEDPQTRVSMAQSGQRLVDGQGVVRVLNKLQRCPIRLRPASHEDSYMVWQWANAPSVRSVSFSTEPIPWDEHRQWYSSKIHDPNCAFFIALDGGGVPLGQVRADVAGGNAVISISLDTRYRSQGLGKAIIQKACQELFESWKVNEVYALIREENEKSRWAFLNAGFREGDRTKVQGYPANRLVLRK
jgi:UDP-2,4-diacetamido-2,4,6-trideoxy-beta-L-altropyranose hydrolase